MNKLAAGVVASTVATVVLSLIMVLKGMMGVMPELDIISMLAGMMGASAIVGWIMHFMVGAGYGVAFSQINSLLPGNFIVKGIIIGILGWLVMMLMLMPMMGAGMFAMNMGMMAPVMTLMLHIIFGAVLGLVYKKLQSS